MESSRLKRKDDFAVPHYRGDMGIFWLRGMSLEEIIGAFAVSTIMRPPTSAFSVSSMLSASVPTTIQDD